MAAVSVRPEEKDEEEGCCRSCTNKLNRVLENFFGSVGFIVGGNPWKTIIISLICCALCVLGVLEYQVENRGFKNWVSQTSDAIKHKDWVDDAFPAQFRDVNILLETKDGSSILTGDAMRQLRNIDKKVREIYANEPNRQWSDICFEARNNTCVPPKSILELWSYNDTLINALKSDETDVKDMLNQTMFNKTTFSPMTGQIINMDALIGGDRQYKDGVITFGSVLKITYQLRSRNVFVKSSGRLEDKDAEAWEEKLDELMKGINLKDYNTYSFSLWSNDKVSGDASNGDTQFFIVGYILVIFYLAIVLGSFSRLNHKVYLALGGILTIGLSIGVAYGLGSAFQLRATPVHNVLPFLLLGIGVDDIFVIVQCWDNIQGPKLNPKDHDSRTIAEKISLTIRHAGVSVLVTSLTDICAFLIGATTILPALQSFCIWCGIGILSVFLLTLTFFTALLALDAKRQENNRDACCCCCVKIDDNWTPLECSKKNRLQNFMGNYFAPAILSVPGKIICMLIIAGFLACGVYGVAVELEQDFDFAWFLPSDSRPRMYNEKDKVAFPNDGFFGNVYIGDINYYKEREAMYKIESKLKEDQFIGPQTVKSWYRSYYTWLQNTRSSSLICANNAELTSCQTLNETMFYDLLNIYLASTEGKFFIPSIKFKDGSRRQIKASKMGYIHTKFEKAADEIKGMNSVQDKINSKTIPVETNPLLPFAYAPFYISWETNKVISEELGRNLGLAMLCVFLVTLFLLSNIFASFLVLICVVLALVDITGFMAFWGLTIDTVTTIILVIAIGLTVDYSAHIAHAFMVAKEGDKNERMRHGLSTVGPAVVNGGFSTFLAFVLLAASTSYVFFTFFKVFFLVVIFGMMHGLVFLPIMLSLVGPRPYAGSPHEGEVTAGKPRANGKSDPTSNGDVSMEKVKTNEEMYVVTENGGTKNLSFTPE